MKIDLTEPKNVIKELLEDDRWVKELFQKHLEQEFGQLAEALAHAFKILPKLNDAVKANETEQTALIEAFAFGVADDVLTSSKLLFSGKLAASGNLMRQAIEGIAVAVLCSASSPVIAPGKNGKSISLLYWRGVLSGDRRVESHKALAQLDVNCDALGVSRNSVIELRKAQKHYHQFSHPSVVTIANRVSLGSDRLVYVGGAFDPDKLDGYQAELIGRIEFGRLLPNLYERLIQIVSQI